MSLIQIFEDFQILSILVRNWTIFKCDKIIVKVNLAFNSYGPQIRFLFNTIKKYKRSFPFGYKHIVKEQLQQYSTEENVRHHKYLNADHNVFVNSLIWGKVLSEWYPIVDL